MLLGPRSSVVLFLLSCSLQSLHSRLSLFISRRLIPSRCAVFRPLITTRYIIFLALAYTFRLPPVLRLSLSLFLVSEDLLTRGPRVSRRALWWLLRWLLASLESSRESVPPEGQGTPSGTGSPPSLPLSTPSLSTPPPLPLSLSPFPFPLTAPRTAANPPYAPSGSYLRVLLIFSYYRRGHVGMFHTHMYKSSSYIHGVRSTSRFTGLPPSYSAPFPMFLSSSSPSPSPPPRCFSQVLQYVSTLLQRRKRSGRDARVMGSLSREGAKTR